MSAGVRPSGATAGEPALETARGDQREQVGGRNPSQPILSLAGITKEFRRQRVLHGVDFELRCGEVHALAGSNGSGKSTLMKVVYGAHQPSQGTMAVRGATVRFRSPVHALRAGIAAVPQELPLFSRLSVAENIFFGDLPRRRGVVRWREVHRRSMDALAQVDAEHRIDPAQEVWQLDLAAQQLVSIARALAHGADIIVFDEPTSFLGTVDTERLFAAIAGLRSEGRAVGFISQRLDDILAVADRVSVLRDGRMVGELAIGDTTTDGIAELMAGHSKTARRPRSAAPPGRKVLEVDRLSAGRRLRGLTFSVGAGEVVGLAGLPGSGAEDVFPALLGRRATTGGSVRIRGRDVTHSSLRRRIRAGVAYVSGDRRSEGLVRAQTVAFNLALVLNNRVRLVPISHRRQGRKVEEVISKLRIHPADPAALVATLSGGNQQKVVVGRWLLVEPHLWLLNDPTRGVDVHSREEIHALVREQVSTGESSALMTSSDTRELLEVCDRLLVLDHGEIVAELDPAETTEHKVLALAGGARSQGGR